MTRVQRSTPLTDRSNSLTIPEHENWPVSGTTCASLDSPQPPAVKTPVSALAPPPPLLPLRSRSHLRLQECGTAQTCSRYLLEGERDKACVGISQILHATLFDLQDIERRLGGPNDIGWCRRHSLPRGRGEILVRPHHKYHISRPLHHFYRYLR